MTTSAAFLLLLLVPTIPSLAASALLVWLFLRMKQDPHWRARGLAGASAPVV